MKISRRALLGGAAATLGAASIASKTRLDLPLASGKWAKNVIFCVVDGMPVSCMSIIDYLAQSRSGENGYWAWLYNQPGVVNGLQETRSLSSVVTDSSAASSTWGSGCRIWNGMVNMYPDKTKLETLTQLASAEKIKCGLVTTTRVTHATPAGFAVNCIFRDLEDDIAALYLDSGVDVLMGGGSKNFTATGRKDKTELIDKYRAAGFEIVREKSSLGKGDGRLLALFSSSHVPYTVDRLNNPTLQATVPTLAEMTKEAIRRLDNGPNGFILQVEGGRVDHGGHANDVAAMVFDQIEFEEAVKAAIDFAVHDGETLVVITADHACGGLALNGSGNEYFDSTAGMKSLENIKASYDVLIPALGATPTLASVKDAFKQHAAIELPTEEAQIIVDAGIKSYEFGGSIFFRSMSSTLGMVIGNHTKTTFTGSNHTNDHVLVTAYGPGAERCAGVTRNVEFNRVMLEAKGLRHNNRQMDFATAAAAMERLKTNPPEELLHGSLTSDDCSCSDHPSWPIYRREPGTAVSKHAGLHRDSRQES